MIRCLYRQCNSFSTFSLCLRSCRASVASTVIIGSAIASALHGTPRNLSCRLEPYPGAIAVYHSARMLELYEVKSKRLVIWGTIVLTLLAIAASCGFSVQILFSKSPPSCFVHYA